MYQHPPIKSKQLLHFWLAHTSVHFRRCEKQLAGGRPVISATSRPTPEIIGQSTSIVMAGQSCTCHREPGPVATKTRTSYVLSYLDVTKHLISCLDRLFNFIWKNKPHNIKPNKPVMSVSLIKKKSKINWIKRFLTEPHITLNIIPNFLLKKKK